MIKIEQQNLLPKHENSGIILAGTINSTENNSEQNLIERNPMMDSSHTTNLNSKRDGSENQFKVERRHISSKLKLMPVNLSSSQIKIESQSPKSMKALNLKSNKQIVDQSETEDEDSHTAPDQTLTSPQSKNVPPPAIAEDAGTGLNTQNSIGT